MALKISRIWSNANDVHVCHYLVYVNADNTACIDPEGTIPVCSEMLRDLYLKTLLISDNGVLYSPISMTIGDPTVSISYIKNVGGVATFSTTTSSEEFPFNPELVSLDIGGKTLTPVFSSDVVEYAMTTTDASNLVTMVTSPTYAVVSMTLNTVAVEDPEAALTWETGANIVTITLALEADETVYTITVTKE